MQYYNSVKQWHH